MKEGKKRLPRTGDPIKFKETAEYAGETGLILEITVKNKKQSSYLIQCGDHDDPWEIEVKRSEFYLIAPNLGHPLTKIFELV